MRISFVALIAISVLMGCQNDKKQDASASTSSTTPGPITLVIHGGAGTIKRENMTPEREKAYREGLNQALEAGYGVLESGGPRSKQLSQPLSA